MLQRSISTSSLLKQATAAVVAQENEGRRIGRPGLTRSHTDFDTFPFNSRRMSKDASLLASNASSSGAMSPNSGKRRIHFNEKVEQCIAVEFKGEDDDENIRDEMWDTDSDDAIMMKRSRTKKKRVPILRRKSTGSVHANGKIIAKLPSTTLKYRDEEDEQETAMKHSTKVYRSPIISPSSSQETLRADSLKKSKTGRKFYMGSSDDEDEDDDDDDEDIPPHGGQTHKPKAPTIDDAGSQGLGLGLKESTSTGSLTAERAGMRRTASGMLMPVDDEEAVGNDGIFGRVIDTVNTARDIAHVIWNVGWRK